MAPFPPFLIPTVRPAWFYPNILVLTEGGFKDCFSAPRAAGNIHSPKQLAVWATLRGRTVSYYDLRGVSKQVMGAQAEYLQRLKDAPFARYADDKDMNDQFKEAARWAHAHAALFFVVSKVLAFFSFFKSTVWGWESAVWSPTIICIESPVLVVA